MTVPFGNDALSDQTVNPANPDVIEDGWSTRKPGPTEYGDPMQPAMLLSEPDPTKVAKAVHKMWTDQDKLHQKHLAQCRANRLRREGHINVSVVKSQDYDRWEEWTWGGPSVPHLNHAATLCRKMVANLYADPPAPDPLPASGEPDDLDAADFAGRVLEDLTSESGLDDVSQGRLAFDLASTYGSAFRYFRVNPQGSKAALEIEAHPQALTANAPFSIPAPPPPPMAGGMGAPASPGTPLPIPSASALSGAAAEGGGAPGSTQPQTPTGPMAPPMIEAPGPYVLRYVMPDGTLTDERAKAALQWVPTIEDEVVTSRHVRFLPATAASIWKAHGVVIGGFKSVGELKRMFPEAMKGMTPEQVSEMCRFRPEKPDDFLPGKNRSERGALEGMEGENRQAFVLTCYYTECPDYPMGAHLVVGGDTVLLYREPWSATAEDGTQDTLMLPLTQYMQFNEGREGQYGVALMELLGPGNEIRAAQLGAALEYLDRFNARKTFLPTNSLVNPEDLENPTRLILPMNPGGAPVYEEMPDFPQMSMDLYERSGADMDHTSGLEQAAQGVEDPSVTSGRHARVIVAQVHAGLSEPRQNVERATVRGYRIVMQLVRGYFTKPQKLRWTGQDGRFMEKRWSRADLKNTKDVRLKPATLTMLSPSVKIEYVQDLVGMGLIPPDEARDLLSSSLAATTGWKDEPHRLRIKRQLAEWNDGPPEGWQPPPPPTAVQTPMGMQVAPPPVDPLWQPVPADQLPPVAQIRLLEIAKAMASQTYFRWTPDWRAPLEQEFALMQQVVAQAMAPAPAPAAPGGPPPASTSTEAPPTDAERQQAASAPPGLGKAA